MKNKIIEKVDKLTGNVEKLSKTVEKLTDIVIEFRDATVLNFEKVYDKFAMQNQRFDGIDKGINTLGYEFHRLEDVVLKNHEVRIVSLEKKTGITK